MPVYLVPVKTVIIEWYRVTAPDKYTAMTLVEDEGEGVLVREEESGPEVYYPDIVTEEA